MHLSLGHVLQKPQGFLPFPFVDKGSDDFVVQAHAAHALEPSLNSHDFVASRSHGLRFSQGGKNVKKNSSGKIRKDPLTRKYRGKVPTQMDDFKQKSRQCQSQRQATSLPPSLSSARSSVHSASCHLPSAVSITLSCVCCTRQR